MRVIEHLLNAVRGAAVYNPEVQVAPACIQWQNCDRQWESVIPRLRTELEKRLHERRLLVWAELGEAPLAQALKYLAVLPETTACSLEVGSPGDIAVAYSISGWQADNAMVRALACLHRLG